MPPASALPRSGIDASIVAHIAAAHFTAHVPYYRLEQQLARTGVSLARSTQVSLMAQFDARVGPLVEVLKQQVLASGYMWDENGRQLARKPLMMVATQGRGVVVGFTADPNFRGYLDGLNVLFVNAVFRGPAHARPAP